MELISVIVPVYNVEKEIRRCLDSIQNQTYHNIEVIAVNDGSTDNSGTILDEYEERYPNIKVVHKDNEGVTSARLSGIKKACGEWVGFVDGDDYIESDMFEMLFSNAKKYNADISHCGYQMVFDDGRVRYFHNTGCLVEQDRRTGLIDLLDGSKIEPGLCNKLFHRNLFHSLLHTECMPTDIKINEDLLMNFFLFSAAEKSVFEDQCKYHYIVRNNSASRKKINQHRIVDPIKVKEIILENIDENILENAQKAYLSTCINAYNSLLFADKNDFLEEKAWVKDSIIRHVQWRKLLSKKQQLLMNMIKYTPEIYPIMYKIYAKYVMKNPYGN